MSLLNVLIKWVNQEYTGTLHKAAFSNYSWHIIIIIAKSVNTKKLL